LTVSQFLYLSFVTIIRETSRLCRKLRAILYLVQFPHFCADTDMIAAYKVLIYINSCYTANRVSTSYTKCHSILFATFFLYSKQSINQLHKMAFYPVRYVLFILQTKH